MAKKVKNIDGEYVDLEVIRYFMNNDVEYLIYSLNEIDESGYTKLYASKIIGSKACIITENDEWNLIKEIIKEIVRCNRDGSELNIIDLDENNLDVNIEVDGGINDKTAEIARNAGADILVSGSYILNSGDSKKAIRNLKGEV